MSSAAQATSSSTSNSQLIIDALAHYTNITGIDLSKNSFAAKLELSNSPQDILQLLQQREKAFKEYRDGNQRLMDSLNSTVSILQPFSRILGEVVGGPVSEQTCAIL
jgi:cell shape-determining protein MreC